MKLKVKQAIKGLVPGDILYYKSRGEGRTGVYEINKIEEDVSDNGATKKQLKVIIDEWYVKNWKDYFVYIDDDDNEVMVEELEFRDPNLYPTKEKLSENEELKLRIESLEKQLEEYNRVKEMVQPFYKPVRIDRVYSPYRLFWDW